MLAVSWFAILHDKDLDVLAQPEMENGRSPLV